MHAVFSAASIALTIVMLLSAIATSAGIKSETTVGRGGNHVQVAQAK